MHCLITLAFATASALLVSAQICDPPSDGIWLFNSQASVDLAISNCTTLKGIVQIGPKYNGSFTLNGITNITDSIWTFNETTVEYDNYTFTNVDDYTVPKLTSIILPDLQYIMDIRAIDTPAMTRISAPKLTQIDWLQISSPSEELLELDFPALVKAVEIEVNANCSSINFNQLENVYDFSVINSGNDEVALHLPSLKYVSFAIYIDLPLANFTVPLLQSVTNGSAWYSEGGMQINNRGLPLDINLPELQSVNYELMLQGNISKLSIPKLTIGALFEGINIYPDVDFSVDFAALTNATVINLWGKISEVSFPALKDVDAIEIYTSLPFNCTNPWGKGTHLTIPTDTSRLARWTCTSTYESTENSHKSGLTQDDKVAIGVGVGLGVPVVIAIGLLAWLYRKRNKGQSVTPEPKGVTGTDDEMHE